MKIGVLLKQVPDTETRIRIKPDGSGIETGEIKWIVNPYDEFAVEAGLRLREKVSGEVVVVSLGPARAQDALRTALAMGADRAVLLDADAFQDGDSLATARALAKVVEQEGFEIVFTGKQAIDDDAVQVPQIVAELLDWPHVTNIDAFELQDGGTARVKRGVGGGVTEVIDAQLPVVLSCDKGLNEPRYASLPGIMKAKTKPLARKAPADLGLDAADTGRAGSAVVASEFHLPPDRPAGRMVTGPDLRAACAELVRLLREEAKVL